MTITILERRTQAEAHPHGFGHRPGLSPLLVSRPKGRDRLLKKAIDLSAGSRSAAVAPMSDWVLPLDKLTVRDQDAYPACIGFGVRGVIQQQAPMEIRAAMPFMGKLASLSMVREIAPMMVWYEARRQDGTEHAIEGAFVSGALYAMMHGGFCAERDMPYVIDDSVATQRPSDEALQDADDNSLDESECATVEGPDQYESILRSGFGIVDGMTVGSNFMNFRGGEEDVIASQGLPVGGHCTGVFGVRYRRRGGLWHREFARLNSWGLDWGSPLTDMNGHVLAGGCAWVDESLVIDATDAWMVRLDPKRELTL